MSWTAAQFVIIAQGIVIVTIGVFIARLTREMARLKRDVAYMRSLRHDEWDGLHTAIRRIDRGIEHLVKENEVSDAQFEEYRRHLIAARESICFLKSVDN